MGRVGSSATAAALLVLLFDLAELDAGLLARDLLALVGGVPVALRVALRRCGAVAHDLAGDFEKHFVDIMAGLGRGLEELESVLVGEGLALLGGDHAVGQVDLVGDEHLGHARARVRLDLLEPVLNVVKSLLLRAVVDQHDAHGSFVVRLRDRAEPLLARRVPHLQLDPLVLNLNRLDLEVDPCTRLVTLHAGSRGRRYRTSCHAILPCFIPAGKVQLTLLWTREGGRSAGRAAPSQRVGWSLTDGRHVGSGEVVLAEAEQDATLAH